MRSVYAICILCLLGLCAGLRATNTPGLDKAQLRGKQIYLQGTSASGSPITANLGEDPNRVPGAAFPCANCHGRNGQGKPEGGTVPSDIRWTSLAKPYELTLSSGRKRGPYTEHLVKRAITLGFDSSNNALSAAMPRFQMSQSDLVDLLAYMKILGSEADPGVADDQLRIGVILPPRRLAKMHDAVESVLKTYFEQVNRQGGIFGRRLEMRSLDYPEFAEERGRKIRDFLAAENIFALASSFMAGDEAALAPIFQETETPVVGAFALFPQMAAPLNPFVFYLDEGMIGQVKALAGFAAKRFHQAGGQPAIIYADNPSSRQLADAVEQECKQLGMAAPLRVMISGESKTGDHVLRQIAQARSIFWLLPYSALRTVLQQAGESAVHASFLIPSALAQNDTVAAPSFMNGRIFMASPALPLGLSENLGAAEFRNLSAEQRAALAGARTLVEALKRTGRELSREALIETLEHLSSFDTGLAPPLSYSPNQRAGNTAIQIMGLKNGAMTLEQVETLEQMDQREKVEKQN